MPPSFALARDVAESKGVLRVDYNMDRDGALLDAVNAVIEAAPGQWLYVCYNAEYLFYPFCETRTVGEMLAFHTEERRDAMLTYVVDLYADGSVRLLCAGPSRDAGCRPQRAAVGFLWRITVAL
mgnify:CR=1 FL=1